MPFVKRVRDYYKYGTEPNANIVGSFARIDKGVASGFTTSNYLQIPEKVPFATADSFEMVFCFVLDRQVTSPKNIFRDSSGAYTSGIVLNSDGTLSVQFNRSSGDAYFITYSTEEPLEPNVKHWVKVTYSGTIYNVYHSKNGVDYTQLYTKDSNYRLMSLNYTIGTSTQSSYQFPFTDGSINLSECYIKINNELWWSGDNYTKVGSWIDDGVVGVFSSANHLTLPTTFKPENNTWEMCFKIHTPVSSGKYGPVLGKYTSDTYYGLRLEISATGKVYYMVSGTSGKQYIFEGDGANTLPIDSDVYMKLSFTGSKYIGEISLDGGVSWIVDREFESTTPLYNWDSATTIGYYAGRGDSNPGYIDFNESYIKINDKLWWHGTKVYQINVSDKDIYEDWSQPVLTNYGTTGGSSFAVAESSTLDSGEEVWRLFASSPSYWHSAANLPQWISWYNPNPLKVTKLSFTSASGNHRNIEDFIIQACDDNSSWIDILSYSNANATGDFEVDLSSNDKAYKYWRIYITSSHYANVSYYAVIYGLKITAQQLMPTGTIEDADYSILRNKLYQLAKPKRTYYKYGNEINANVVGSFGRITDGVAGGFTTSNYLEVPNKFSLNTSDSFEIVTSFVHKKQSSSSYILGASADAILSISTTNNNVIKAAAGNGSSWYGDLVGKTTLSEGVKYWVKLLRDVSGWYLSLSTDGVSYELEVSNTWSTVPASTNILIGYVKANSSFIGYSIDLNETYIKINKELWWNGNTYNKIGSWIENGVIGTFGRSNYTSLPFTFTGSSYNNWELVTKINLNSYTNAPAILCVNSSYGIFNYSIQSSGRQQLALSTSTDTFNICDAFGEKILDLNTWYWLKAEFTGEEYNTYWSIDGKIWNLDSSVKKTTKLGTISVLNFGIRTKNYDQTLDGLIDMKQCYLKTNGEEVWRGTNVSEINVSNKDTYTVWTQPVLSSDGVLGLDNFAVYCARAESSYPIYKAFDGSASSFASIAYPDSDIIIYNPVKLKVNKVTVANRSDVANSITGYTISGSDNNITWTNILSGTNDITSVGKVWNIDLSSNTKGFKYYKISVTSAILGGADFQVGEITLEGKQLMATGSIEEADYYQDRLLSYSPILRNAKHFVTLFESTAAGTYDVNIPNNCTARVTLVGGGGAAAMLGRYDDRGYGWTGGSGGAFMGTYELEAGTYSVTVGSANNNTKGQGGNTNTMNPDDTSTHDSYITGLVRVGGGGAGTTSGVGAAGASATFEVEPVSVTLNSTGNAGAYGSGGKGSGANWTHNGAESVYKGYGKGQGCSTSEYASRRYWISGTDGYARIEIMSLTEKQLY